MLTSPTRAELRRSLPGEPGWPLIGHSIAFITDPLGLALRYHAKYGPVAWGSGFGLNSVFALGPEVNETIFRNVDGAYTTSSWEYYIGPFFRRGLMLMDGDEHKLHRGVMMAAFKRPVLERYFAMMLPSIARAFAGWPVGATTKVAPRLKQLTLDVATEVFMGEPLGPEAQRVNRAFIDAVRGGTAIVRRSIPFGRWRRGLEGRAVLEAFVRSRIPAKRAHPADDLFSRLCEASDEAGNRFSDDDVVNHMIFLMMAAHDTSTITLTSTLYRLAKHPEWQARVRDEVRACGPLRELADLDKLPVLDRVIKEAMRLLTPLHVTSRRTVKETTLAGHTLAPGTYIVLCPAATHRMKEHWTDPDRWDPDRFDDARAEHKKHPFLFVPFGGGAHRCIGATFGEMEIKAIVHHVLSHDRLTVPAAYELPLDYTSLPSAKDGLPIRLDRA